MINTAELLDVLEQIESAVAAGPVLPSVTPAEIRGYLNSNYDFQSPIALQDLTAGVEQMLKQWQVQVTHPHYLGLFNPSVTRASVVGDLITAAYNPQLATWRTSPAANEIERHTLSWLAAKFGLPRESHANFTSGGAESNLSAVAVALTRSFPEYSEHGTRSLRDRPAIYLSEQAHHSFNKIAHLTGIGRQAIRPVAVADDLRMDMKALQAQIAADRKEGFAPFMVIGTAGTTAAGVVDPLPALASHCRAEGIWFHVDAAWGGAAIVSPKLRHHLAGIECADSITCDAHKWFSTPMGAGMFFCRQQEAVKEAFRVETSYMPPKTCSDTVDPYVTSVQWSRRFTGLKFFLSLAHHGESGYAEMIEHQAAMGDVLRSLLRKSQWQIVNETPFPVVCFRRRGLDVSRFLSRLYEKQVAWMSETRIRGEVALRACITSFRSTENDLESIVMQMNGLV